MRRRIHQRTLEQRQHNGLLDVYYNRRNSAELSANYMSHDVAAQAALGTAYWPRLPHGRLGLSTLEQATSRGTATWLYLHPGSLAVYSGQENGSVQVAH